MRFGFGSITCQQHPAGAASPVALYREAIAVVEEAERLGFDSAWVSEHHFFDDGYLPSVLPLCAALAARTSRIALGTGVALAPLYDPVRLAEDAATVDLLSGGRFLLGLAVGWRAEEFDGLGIPWRERGRRTEAAVATLRQAWSDGLTAGGVPVTPKPARPGGPPIWLGGTSEPAVRRAGRVADGFLASWGSVDEFARNVALVREELERAGRDPAAFRFAIVNPTFAWPGGDAWERIREPYLYYAWKYRDMAAARGRTGPPPALPRLDPGDEAALRATAVLGRPEDVAEQLLRYDAVVGGGLHYVAEFCWPGLDPGVLREAMAVFAGAVIPACAAATAPPPGTGTCADRSRTCGP